MIWGLLILLAAPFVLTQPAFIELLDFSESGQIGDTIGGITAPIVSFIGAVLIYYSFEQQIEANKIQREALNIEIKQNRDRYSFDILDKHYTEIKTEFDKIVYKRGSGERLKGEDALDAYSDDLNRLGDEFHLEGIEFEYHLSFLALLINSFIEELKASELPHDTKKYLYKKFYYFYTSKIEFYFDRLVSDTNDLENFYNLNIELSEVTENIKAAAFEFDVDSPNS